MTREFEIKHAKHISEHLEEFTEWASERNYFVERLCAAEFHWFFVQGLDAILQEFYVPGVSSLLNGIEASLRVTSAQVTSTGKVGDLSPYRVMSNNLIKKAQDLGMPVEALAFPDETDFLAKLATEKPNRTDVAVVRQRNNICHGDISEYINRDLGATNTFFTPECLRPLAYVLLDVSHNWVEKLGMFRRSKGFLHCDDAGSAPKHLLQ